MAGLRLIVGLGNPGAEHARTRHNAGFWFVDALAQAQGARFGIESKLHAETARVVIGGEPPERAQVPRGGDLQRLPRSP